MHVAARPVYCPGHEGTTGRGVLGTDAGVREDIPWPIFVPDRPKEDADKHPSPYRSLGQGWMDGQLGALSHPQHMAGGGPKKESQGLQTPLP